MKLRSFQYQTSFNYLKNMIARKNYKSEKN